METRNYIIYNNRMTLKPYVRLVCVSRELLPIIIIHEYYNEYTAKPLYRVDVPTCLHTIVYGHRNLSWGNREKYIQHEFNEIKLV